MKKLILCVIMFIFAASAGAQESGEVSQWLTEFSEINASGPFHIVFEQVSASEAPRIVYDTKGSYTSKFRAEVKNGVLQISERAEARRMTVTEVKVCYHSFRRMRLSGVTAAFQEPVTGTMADFAVSGGAVLTAAFDVTDLDMEVTGKSRVQLSGKARYFSLRAASSKVDAAQLEVMAAMAEASNGAEVSLDVTERLEAKTSTDARITYAGNPSVVRGGKGFTGGEIVRAE